MNEVSSFRLYVLRAMYLFIVAGLGVYLWPGVLNPQKHWELAQGMQSCMLAAFSLLCLLGLRFPLQMLPILLWEVTWKTLWLLLVPFPQWRAGHRPSVRHAARGTSVQHLRASVLRELDRGALTPSVRGGTKPGSSARDRMR